jgi:tripartite-type tricarboxylate transporter receptor subunit TctC
MAHRRQILACTLLALTALGTGGGALAQASAASFPDKPMKIVVTFTTGEVAKKLTGIGLEPVGFTPDELATDQKTEITKWAKVVKDSGAKVD